MIYIYTFLILFSFNLYSDPKDKIIHIVKPANETPQVISKGDAADDPAIWFNQFSPNNSIIFGTDKRSGVYSYNLAGKKIGYSNLGNINNIDIRSINLDEEGTYIALVSLNVHICSCLKFSVRDSSEEQLCTPENTQISCHLHFLVC